MDFRPDVLWDIVNENFCNPDHEQSDWVRKYIKAGLDHQLYQIAMMSFCPPNMNISDSWIFKPFPSFNEFEKLYNTTDIYTNIKLPVNVKIFINNEGAMEALLSPMIAYIGYESADDFFNEDITNFNFE